LTCSDTGALHATATRCSEPSQRLLISIPSPSVRMSSQEEEPSPTVPKVSMTTFDDQPSPHGPGGGARWLAAHRHGSCRPSSLARRTQCTAATRFVMRSQRLTTARPVRREPGRDTRPGVRGLGVTLKRPLALPLSHSPPTLSVTPTSPLWRAELT
jgi:hypothetical protein